MVDCERYSNGEAVGLVGALGVWLWACPVGALEPHGFTRDRLQASLFNNRILHLATHGRFSPTNAANSALLLGQGNNELLLPEVETLRGLGNVHLVVLSACETALTGDPDETGFSGADGREINSLAYSFTRGDRAKAILASLT